MPSPSGRLIARAKTDSRVFLFPRGAVCTGRGSRDGFTLLEILVTLALIALLSTVLITGSIRMLNEAPTTPGEVFRKALSESRHYAVLKNIEVRLSYDPDGKMFRLATPEGERPFPVTVPVSVTGTGPADLAIDFLAAQKGSAMLLGGVLVETQKLTAVTFYPDGTCSPFRLQIRIDSNITVTAIDPWTCAPVLDAEKS